MEVYDPNQQPSTTANGENPAVSKKHPAELTKALENVFSCVHVEEGEFLNIADAVNCGFSDLVIAINELTHEMKKIKQILRDGKAVQ